MIVSLRTNLDLHQSDTTAMDHLSKLLSKIGYVPRINELIELNTLTLEVCGVTYKESVDFVTGSKTLYTEVELSLWKSVWGNKTMRDFYEWYAPRWGQTAGNYI